MILRIWKELWATHKQRPAQWVPALSKIEKIIISTDYVSTAITDLKLERKWFVNNELSGTICWEIMKDTALGH